jgi:hypothetical protein
MGNKETRNNLLHDQIMESKMWGEIRRLAPHHPALKDALDRVVVIYNLLKVKR